MSYLTRKTDFFLRENNFKEFCIQKVVILVIASVNSFALFTTYGVLLLIC